MKDDAQVVSAVEKRKNLVAGGIAGGMLGLGLGYGFGSMLLGLVTGILFGIAIGFRIGRMPIKMRYPMHLTRRMLLTGSLFLLMTFGYALFLDRNFNQVQLILVALVSTIAGAAFVVSIGSAIAGLDELQRRIQTEAIAIGFAGTAIVCVGYGLMSLAGIPPVNWAFVALVMVVMWLVGKLWTLWRYR
jgi:hypothetical protein